jgi:hypothetical protein
MSAPSGWLLGVLVLVLAGDAGARRDATPEAVMLHGKVLTLSSALASRGLSIKVDAEPIAKQVALVADDGSVIPLFSDDASRALFLDDRLRDCRAEVVGRRFAGVPYLQVVSFKVERQGKFQTPEYFCDVCSIHVRYPQDCPCCQGPMELQMKTDGG